MTLVTTINDGFGTGIDAHVHKHPRKVNNKDHNGLLVITDRFRQFRPIVKPFLNPTKGIAMNQDVGFSDTPEIIHNGGSSTEWTGSAVQGTWDFSTGAVITLTSGTSGDAATFSEEGAGTINMNTYTTLTGTINLTTYSATNNVLSIIFDLADVSVGNSVNLDDFIDPGLIGVNQNFVIPKSFLGLNSQLVDGFTITLSRTGGPLAGMTFDNIQLEQTGEALEYRISATNSPYHLTEFRINLADVLPGVVPDADAVRPSVPLLSYDKILNIAALSNGIVFRRVQDGITRFSVVLKTLGDFISTGSDVATVLSDATNTYVQLRVQFPEAILLEGDSNENFLSYTINDDLSGLLQFTILTRGAEEA